VSLDRAKENRRNDLEITSIELLVHTNMNFFGPFPQNYEYKFEPHTYPTTRPLARSCQI